MESGVGAGVGAGVNHGLRTVDPLKDSLFRRRFAASNVNHGLRTVDPLKEPLDGIVCGESAR